MARAEREALAILLDVSPSMSSAPAGHASPLETSLDIIQMLMQRLMFQQSRDEVCLILFGTDETEHDLSDGNNYPNISVVRTFELANWDFFESLKNVKAGNATADILDALVFTADYMRTALMAKKGIVEKRILLFTDYSCTFSISDFKDIRASIKQQEIRLDCVGPNFSDDDDDENTPSTSSGRGGPPLKQRTAQQRATEKLVKRLEGATYSFSEALQVLSVYQTKTVKPSATKFVLEICPDVKIPVASYIRVRENKPEIFRMKKVFAKDTQQEVKIDRARFTKDEEERDVDQDELVDGYRYGSTFVPFSKTDEANMKYKTEKALAVLGFTKSKNIKRHMCLGEGVHQITVDAGNQAAVAAFNALVHALYELDMVAIVRKVFRASANVETGYLQAHVKAKSVCLYYIRLPFSEDTRQFTFDSLEQKAITPNDEQLNAMDELISTMDLTKSEDGDNEALKPKLCFNPYIQRMFKCFAHRAMNPDDPLPDLAEDHEPPPDVAVQAGPVIDKMKRKFPLKEVAKAKKLKTGEDVFKESDEGAGPSAANDEELDGGIAGLSKNKVTDVGTVDPVGDFKALIGNNQLDKACDQIKQRISSFIMDTIGNLLYDKAKDCLRSLRDETIKAGKPELFNAFLRALKADVVAKGRQDFWDAIVLDGSTLISSDESAQSAVSSDEAKAFLRAESKYQPPASAKKSFDDADDLMDEL